MSSYRGDRSATCALFLVYSGSSYKLVLLAGDVGNVHVVGGHVDDLARAVLDDDVTVLAESGTLHGVGGRGTRIGGVEGHLML